MFEKLSTLGIEVILLAQGEARRLGHNFVGTEQILLGLIGSEKGLASKVLKSQLINLRNAREEVERIIGRGSGFVADEIPFTPKAKVILEISLKEAQKLGRKVVCTEHLLLGILKHQSNPNDSNVAGRVLENLGIDLTLLEKELFKKLKKTKKNFKYKQGNKDFDKNELSEEEKNIINKLEILGINNAQQLTKQDLFYWWQKTYLQISNSAKENKNELLIDLNNAREELEVIDKKSIIKTLRKKGDNTKKQTANDCKKEGDILRERKKYKESIFFYNSAINKERNYSSAYFCRGLSKYYLEDFNGATSDWQKFIDISDKKIDTYLQIGEFLFKNLDYSKAIEYYSYGIKIHKYSKLLYSQRGYVYQIIRNYKSSLSDFEKVIRLNPKFFEQNINKKFKDSFEIVKSKIAKENPLNLQQKQEKKADEIKKLKEAMKLEKLKLDEERKKISELKLKLEQEQEKKADEIKKVKEAMKLEKLKLDEERKKVSELKLKLEQEQDKKADVLRYAEEAMKLEKLKLDEERKKVSELKLKLEQEQDKKADVLRYAEEAMKLEKLKLDEERKKVSELKLKLEQEQDKKADVLRYAEEAMKLEKLKLEEERIKFNQGKKQIKRKKFGEFFRNIQKENH